ncbi:Zinc finger-XS domainprobable mediator of RNA polymerase II transcription [Spatholobus suberectus]|nr:Zinc finger-XS domainprobable mediator of RNA polymerase II transcription [Spatholobus suberectus]
MQFNRRREEEHAAAHRFESGSDPFRRNRRDGSDRSPVQQRNKSPRVGGGSKVSSDGFEGRDYDWQHVSGGGRRSGRVRSRSPPAEPVRKRSHFDDGLGHNRSCSPPPPPPPPPVGLRARYELSKNMDYCVDGENLDAKRVYLDREKDLVEGRLGGMVDQKFVVRENEVGGLYTRYRSIPDTGVSVTARYQEAVGHLPPPARGAPMGRFEHERLQHRDGPPPDKMPVTESHSGAEKNILHARDVSYSAVSPSYVKDFAGTSHMRDYGGSSIEMSRGDFLCSHGDGICLPASYDLSRNSGKLAEPVGLSGHGQRTAIDTARGPEIGPRNMTCHQRCEFSPTRTEHVDYLNYKLQVRAAQDERLYQYEDLPRRIAPHGRLDYEQAVTEYDNREFSRPYIPHPDLDRTGKSEDSYGNQRRAIVHDHPALQKQKYFDYHDVRRTSIASMQGEAYLRSGYNHENGKRMPQDYEDSHMGAPEADRLSILRTEYESRRDGGPGLQQERFQSSPLSKHNSETYRQTVRVQEMRQDLGIHDHSDRLMKRKYNVNDEMDVHDLRTIKSSKWGATEEFPDVYESEEWVDDEDMDMLYSFGNVDFNPKIYRKYKKQYDELENEEEFPSDEWILPQDSMGHVQRHSFQFRKYSNQNIKHHSKSSSSNWYKSQHFSKRNAIQKQPKVWKKYHGYDENKLATNDESSEDWISAAESEPTEGSEEFNQMVHENFLMYSKKLNLNLYVQRRYQDQGKAGSLYCIVCGRSSSKEFMDTQRLVTHAFMSHKAGLRAKHLGLHKAICVLMGWDTVVPQDTVTWVPQVLPHAEALAQKEDLILWPPIVIIHNISMSDDNPQNWKVVSMETIEAFLRGKGFVRGRIKLCLGKPADQSIVLVKFLGTFGGLGDAERLHKYLSDNNRGRAEYERVKSESIKSCNIRETDEGDKVENILYGYVGIAEDLDKLDFNSKKWSMVKSRKEIDDLDKAPVKTEERR